MKTFSFKNLENSNLFVNSDKTHEDNIYLSKIISKVA